MGVKIQLLRSTASEWTAKNPTLDAGQPGFEIDTFKLKIGNGSLSWNDLPYISGGFGGNDGPLEYEYDVTMYSNNTIEPSELYFNSLSNNIDFSSYFDDLINNQYTVNLKLTSVNNSNKFLIASCDNITKNSQFGDIDAFWPSRSIKWIIDGGDDQYDSANYINTNYTYVGIPTGSPSSTTLRNISIPYNGGRIAEQSQYWGNNDYVTLYKKSIWAMVAKGSSSTMPNTIFYSGNAGADGDGGKDNGTLTNYNGYQAGYARLYGDDPTYTKLIITKTGTIPSYFIDNNNDTDDDLFGASGVNSDTIAMVVFYGSDTTNPSSLSDLQTLFENFVDSVLSGSNVSQIKNNFYNNFNTLYNSVDPGFWYENFEFFTGTNNGLPNTINGEGGSGSGAIFEVTVDQENNQYTISTSAAGINYVVGDIIKIPGSNLQQPDGISPDEDIYVKVNSIDINGGVDTFSTIISNEYRFINLTILAESDGFRFFDNEKFYLNIDVAGLNIYAIDSRIQDAFNTSVVAGDGINLDYNGGTHTLTVESTANTKILPGDNVIFNYNSGTDELTISANSITVPNLEDILVEGDGIDLAFDEENNTVTISQESIANYTDNRLLTSDGTTTGINAESNLTFDGSVLDINGNIVFGINASPSATFSSRDDQPINILAGSAGASINLDSSISGNNGIDLITTGTGKVYISNAFRLPNTDGNPNQMLITDGAGNASWSNNSIVNIETLEPDGFVNRTDSEISINGSRVFTIQPKSPATSYTIYANGVRVVKSSSESTTLPNSTALYFIYFDKTTYALSYSTTLNFNTQVPIAQIYWNSSDNKAVYFGEERHGIRMDNSTHQYLHNIMGTQYVSGLSISNYSLTGDGSNNSDATIAISDGIIYDEDIVVSITNSASPSLPFEQVLSTVAQIPVYYKNGASGYWTNTTATNFPLKVGTTAQYNLNTGGTWSASDSPNPTNNRYLASWICATSQENAPIIAIMGQTIDSSLLQAQSNNAWGSLNLTGLPIVELRPLYRLIYDTKNSFTNGAKAFLVDILDIRGHIDTVTGLVQNDHGSLYGLADDDHSQYVHIDNARTISAVHTFTNGFNAGNLAINNGNTLSSTDTNGNIILAPNGTGDVQVNADTLRVGDNNLTATITTNGTGNLKLSTNDDISSGNIIIENGVNGNINIGTTSGSGNIYLTTRMTSGANIVIEGSATNANVNIGPLGSGNVYSKGGNLIVGTGSATANIVSNGGYNLKLTSGGGTGNIIIDNGSNVNINASSGRVYIGSGSLIMNGGTATIATDSMSDIILSTNKDTSSSNVRVYSAGGVDVNANNNNININAVNGNIQLSPADNYGNVYIDTTVSGGVGIAVKTAPATITGSSEILNIVQISQASYNSLGSYDSNTLYVIT